MHFIVKIESSLVVFWVVYSVSKVNLPCAALMGLPSIPTFDTAAITPHGCACCSSRTRRCRPVPTTSRNTLRCYRSFLSEAFCRNMHAFKTRNSRVIVDAYPLFRAADTAADGDDSGYRRAAGTPQDAGSISSHSSENYTPVDAQNLEAKTQQLMCMPTIDIKLELQMRGIEHRDLFEKVELARRLAESRVYNSCLDGTSAPPGRTSERTREQLDDERTSSDNASHSGENPTETSPITSSATDKERGGKEFDELHDRDVLRAMRMGKQAVIRELTAMGIEHSRLSDLSFLAQQYANGRQEARDDVGEASWSLPGPIDGDKTRGEARGQRGSESSRDHWTWWNGIGWNGGERTDLPRESDGDGMRVRLSDSRGRVLPKEGFNEAVESPDEEENDGGIMAGLMGENEGGASGLRPREAFLRARADLMSSRELMRVLDNLGERYGIPAPRSELQKAFVSAILRGGNGAVKSAGSVDREILGGQRRKLDIVSLASYSGEEEKVEGEFRIVGWDSYKSALRWARKLTFDELLEELRSRGVQHNPKADYGSLTRALADEVLADEELLEDATKGVKESKVDNVMAMSAQEIIRALREGGEQVDVTASQEELARKLVGMNVRDSRASRDGSVEPQVQKENDPRYRETGVRYRQRQPGSRRRSGDGKDDRTGQESLPGPSSFGIGFNDWLRLGDDVNGRDKDEALVNLEQAVRSVGGAAWRTAKQTGSLLAEAAAGLFPEAYPGEETAGEPEMVKRAAAEHEWWREGGEARPTPSAVARTRTARERAETARRAAASFAQSSANRAGLAVVRSLANGVLLGAEAAADWAGGGALAREYVLLFVAAFCLVFKRGIGASIALLFFVRAGRIALQKLEPRGRASERAATIGPKSTLNRAGVSSTAAASSRRGTRGEGKKRRRPRRSQEVDANPARLKTPTRFSRVRKAEEKEGSSRHPKALWDESDDSDRGCLVM